MIAEAQDTDSGHSPYSPRHKYSLQREQNLNNAENKTLWKMLKKRNKNWNKIIKTNTSQFKRILNHTNLIISSIKWQVRTISKNEKGY